MISLLSPNVSTVTGIIYCAAYGDSGSVLCRTVPKDMLSVRIREFAARFGALATFIFLNVNRVF